jgi:3-methyladenine DNA glycosylase/8-oxoguanine DNA glycosylase
MRSRKRAVELRRRLLEFKGVGPKTAQIYLREAAAA